MRSCSEGSLGIFQSVRCGHHSHSGETARQGRIGILFGEFVTPSGTVLGTPLVEDLLQTGLRCRAFRTLGTVAFG